MMVTSTNYKTADTDIQHSVLIGDVKAHSTLCHSYTYDHNEQLIADVISNSDMNSLYYNFVSINSDMSLVQ